MGKALEKPQEQFFTTKEEYLIYEEQAIDRNEYFNGEITEFPETSLTHGVISGNLLGVLFPKFKGTNHRLFNLGLKLFLPFYQSFTYPDAMVICGNIERYEDRQDVVINPTLVIEIISESSVSRDRNEKLVYYQSLASVQEYLLIDSRQCRVDTFFRKSKREWQMLIYQSMDEIVLLQSLGIEVSMRELYEDVEF